MEDDDLNSYGLLGWELIVAIKFIGYTAHHFKRPLQPAERQITMADVLDGDA